jgi:hypothetical protein
MAQVQIKVVWIVCDDLTLTSGHRISTVFNGKKYVFQIGKSKFLDEYYNPVA